MAEPIARDTLLDELKDSQDKGARVYVFNPDASTEEKAATAGKAQTQLTSVANGTGNGSNGAGAKGSCSR